MMDWHEGTDGAKVSCRGCGAVFMLRLVLNRIACPVCGISRRVVAIAPIVPITPEVPA